MSIGDILPYILDEIGIDLENPQISQNTFQMKQIRSFMNDAGRDMWNRTEWQQGFKDLNILGGLSLVSLPNDFLKMPKHGAVELGADQYAPLRNVTSPQMWQLLAKRPSQTPYFFLEGGSLKFSPEIPTDGASAKYITKNWVEGEKSEITTNSDSTLFPNTLLIMSTVWRYLRGKGLPYDDQMAQSEAEFMEAIKADRVVA